MTAQLNPAYPFEYRFVDQTFQDQYKSETTVGTLANYFSFLAIIISCLGLLGLIIFTAEQRTKEIGVRIVLGATIQNIILMLSKDFVVLVVIAFILSTPLAWYMMDKWLHNYAYRIDISWQIFVVAGSVSIVTGAMGLVLAYGYAKTWSLYIPIAIHLGWNVVQQSVFSNGPIGKQLFVEVMPRPVITISAFSLYFMQLFALVSVLVVNYLLLRWKKQVPRV